MIQSKSFYRSLEKVFAAAGRVQQRDRFAARIAPALLEVLGPALGTTAIHVYERRRDGLAAAKRWGESRPDLGPEILRRLASSESDGIRELPWVADLAVGRVGIFGVGAADGPLLVIFGPGPGALERAVGRSEFLSVLNSLLYAMRQHLEKNELQDLLDQARKIQRSLLPDSCCIFAGFDVYAVSYAASEVGGDLYDFLPVADETLGLAVADASGHGLPAALQARDVAIGLRMAVERDLKIVSAIEKLNRVVHRSGLTSRFVSLLFGELEQNGNFSYVNAGHPPALLTDAKGVRELRVGGMVLGPDPAARYKLGFTHVDRGATLVLYSDGVIERGATWGEEFGLERLKKWLRDWKKGTAEEAVKDLFARMDEHAGGRAYEDDVTVMVVKRNG